MNLIEETISDIKNSNHIEQDVNWVGSSDGKYAMPWNEFKQHFKGIDYSCNYGTQEIASDLVVVFNDGTWLERAEYDGSEWWAYKKQPSINREHSSFSVIVGGYDSLNDLNFVDNASTSDEYSIKY